MALRRVSGKGIDMNGLRCEATQWMNRWARWAPLALAVGLGMAACSTESDGGSNPDNAGIPDGPGGKADNAEQAALAGLTMQMQHQQPGSLDVARTPAGEWFFRLVGSGGDVFLTSNAYSQKTSGLNGLLSVEENGVLLERYVLSPVSAEECSYELRAGNNQAIAHGPLFRTCEEAEAHIQDTRDLVAGVVQYKASMTNGARFDLWKEVADKTWFFVLRASDDRVLLESQSYTARTAAVNGLESVRENGKSPDRYRFTTQSDGSVSISLRAANGQEIAASGPYPTTSDAQLVMDEAVELLVSERVGNPW